MSEDKEEIWCPICDEYKVYKCNQPEEVEKRVISEFVEDIKKEIDYIKTINNYQPWGEGYRQCIAVDTLEEQLNKHIIKKWEKLQ